MANPRLEHLTLKAKGISGNTYNRTPLTPRSILERLLRERELRKSSRYVQPAEEGNKEPEQLCSDSCINENEKGEQVFNEEEVSDASRAFAEEQPFKQHLLVVANRLPVSVIREGVDSYDLEEFDTIWTGEGGM
ncbi:hypothetical protein RIF29_04134 [Crotalaria pallida]|uniref:Uncharacterized protein n=1 Tax=Crotalaria pallida TaxID=3830 RepID=A0AAN9J1G5_CROPI